MYSYALRAFGGQSGWDESELVTLADEREALLRQQPKNLLELPARLDATLRIDLAQRAWNRGDQIACLEQLGKAIGLLPGDEELIAWEQRIRKDGLFPEVDLRAFFLRCADPGEPEEGEGASSSGAALP